MSDTPRTEECECGCCHAVDWGACPEFEAGASIGGRRGETNARCVYCDHAKPCHGRDKGNRYFNGPLRRGER